MRVLLLCLGLLLIATPTFADPFEILILSTHYRTELYTRTLIETPEGERFPVEQRTMQTSLTPLDEFLQGTSTGVFAAATADLFSVMTHTSALFGGPGPTELSARTEALAETILTFSPIQDGDAPLGIEVIGTAQSRFSFGLVSLFDVTADAPLWSYGWDGLDVLNSTVPFEPEFGCCAHAVMDLTTALLASHAYRYTMLVSTNASTDSQSIRMTTDIQPVPEPATLLLFGPGAVGVATYRRLRRRSLERSPHQN